MSPEQIKDMLKIRRDSDILNDENGSEIRKEISPNWITDNLKDLQLAAGLEAAIGKIQNGEWPKVGTEGTDDVRNAILLENLIRTRELLQERMDEVEKEIKKIEAGEKIEEDDKPVASGAMKDKTEDAELVPAE